LQTVFEKNALPLSKGMLSIAVSSGKGGTGKTNVVANLGFTFAQLQKKVLILDGNLGLSNIGGLLGLRNLYSVEDILNNHKSILKVLFKGPGGMLILPASSANEKLVNLSAGDKICLLEELEQIAPRFDVLLIDTAAGISPNVMFFNLLAEESIVVTTSELTSISAAYSLIKIMATEYRKTRIRVLVNFAKTEKEAVEVFKTIIKLANSYLDRLSLDYLGFIPLDEKLNQAVKRQRLVAEVYPYSPSSRRFREMAHYFNNSHGQSICIPTVPKTESCPILKREEENGNKGYSI
jgi:flagellar biosynthesis protein FlhG